MTSDETFTLLLNGAAGADPGPGNTTDLGRRARRYTRRRRATVGAAAAALVLPGLFAVGQLRPDGTPEIVTSDGGASTQPGAGAGPDLDLVLLFERPLPGGSTLRVSATGDPDEIVVEWPGAPAPVPVGLIRGARTGTKVGDWAVVALRACPGEEPAHLRVFPTADPSQSDGMDLVDGLAVAVAPALDPPSPDDDALTVETRGPDGELLDSSGITVIGDEDLDGSGQDHFGLPMPTVGEAVDAEPDRCDGQP